MGTSWHPLTLAHEHLVHPILRTSSYSINQRDLPNVPCLLLVPKHLSPDSEFHHKTHVLQPSLCLHILSGAVCNHKCITHSDSKSAAGATGREGRAAAVGTAGKGATTAAADADASRTCHESKYCADRQVAFPKCNLLALVSVPPQTASCNRQHQRGNLRRPSHAARMCMYYEGALTKLLR